jgi:hypothetical protein
MVALGFGVIWAGYSTAFWGWCLIRGYDVTFGQLVSPTGYYGAGGQSWPPPQIPDSQVFPGGSAASASATSTSPATASGVTMA